MACCRNHFEIGIDVAVLPILLQLNKTLEAQKYSSLDGTTVSSSIPPCRIGTFRWMRPLMVLVSGRGARLNSLGIIYEEMNCKELAGESFMRDTLMADQ